MAKDPVCGMNVDPEKAVVFEHMGKKYYFCSEHCKKTFADNPGKYTEDSGCCH